ncbi:hypothetical protein HYW54_02425 [Candidatus Gottesmanbacteria bacterium]|nr:hypothetical protein [Candidatus Gottesmanbacteria bacterium]
MAKKLPSFLQSSLPSYDLSLLNIEEDKKLIITSILNEGDFQALQWLAKTYSKKDIKNVIQNPTRGSWYEWILKYWLMILDINLDHAILKKAIIKL